MKGILLLFILLTVTLLSCKEDITKIGNFKRFTHMFEKAIKKRDKETLKKIISDKFYYEYRDEIGLIRNYKGEEALEKMDYLVIDKLILGGYSEITKNKQAMCPAFEKSSKYNYVIYFKKYNGGWYMGRINVQVDDPNMVQ